ncbi:MAG: ribosome silencing factor [Taibaiella sp.]|nr:ribosome silencing factor [Taibaiella sp.]
MGSVQEVNKPAARLSKNSKLFKTIINTIKDKKGEGIVVLDLRKISEAVADYFILCDGRSHIQVKSIADAIRDEVEETCEEKPYHLELGEKWTLVDYVNIVVHVFQQEQRQFYSLESLWADAERTEY